MGAGYFATTVTASTPPAKPVKWKATTTDGRTMTTYAESYFGARREAMRELGVEAGELTVETAGKASKARPNKKSGAQ